MAEISTTTADKHDAKYFAAIDCYWAGLESTQNSFGEERRAYWQTRLAQRSERSELAYVAKQTGCFYAGYLLVKHTEAGVLVDLAVNPRFQDRMGGVVISELLRVAKVPNPFTETAVASMPVQDSTTPEQPAILASA